MIVNYAFPQKQEPLWPIKAVDTLFDWNMVGTFLGWGSLFGLIIPPLSPLAAFSIKFILPIAVTLILLLNLTVGLLLLCVKIKNGTLPTFNKPDGYFLTGALSTTLFLIGSIFFIPLYWVLFSFMTSPSALD